MMIMVVITTFSTLPLYRVLGAYTLLILFIVPSVLCNLYLFRALPETRGREVYDIVDQLKAST